MTRKQFDAKVRGFIWIAKKEIGVDLGAKYVEEEIIKFYAQHRYIPRLYVNMKTRSFGMQ